MKELSVVGKSIPKIDARAKVTGRAVYVADLYFPGMLYGKVVRCLEYAHAKVKSLDFTEALKVPGVVKILGPKDVTASTYNVTALDRMVSPEMAKMGGDIEDQRIFTDWVKHQGDAICGIIAKTEEAAEEAAKKIKVEYEPLPVYLTAAESSKPGAIQFHPEKPGNMAAQLPFPGNIYGYGDVDAAMKEAEVIVEDTFYVPKTKQCQMEAHASIALYDDYGRLNCWSGTQMPKLSQTKLALLFDLPMTRVKLNQMTVGGAFGGRIGFTAEHHACAMAMAVPGRHVLVQFLREEDWLASVSRHPGKYWLKIGFKKDGSPVACDAHFTADKGAYYVDAGGIGFTTGAWLLGMYKWGAFRYKGDSYFTNQGMCGAHRGYGNPQTQFVMEQLVDRACAKLGIDPLEWRLKFHKDVGDFGWILGVPYASCGLTDCLKQGAEAIGWKEKRAKYAHQTGTKRRGVGIGVMNHTSGAFPMLLEQTTCTIRLNEDASAEVILSCSDLGTGAHTTLWQIAAETLGFPLEDVHLKTGDSDASGFDIGSHASRTLYAGGNAVIAACEKVKKELIARASEALEISPDDLEIRDKKVFGKGSDKFVDIKEICFRGVTAIADPQTGKYPMPPGQIEAYVSYIPPHNSPPMSASFAEVEVDTETGIVKVLKLVTAYDIGKAIHPDAVIGQLDGGSQQGLGNVLTEDMVYDSKGRCLNNNFTDYKMLGPSDMPELQMILVETAPDPYGPYGAKSVGESGLITPIGAVANAIYQALGIQFLEAPITPERVLAALKAKEQHA
jgi:xanthine dehydrogenase molybdenum-binding subunit